MKPKRTEKAEPISATGLPDPLEQVRVAPTFRFDAKPELEASAEPSPGNNQVETLHEPSPEREPTMEAVGPLTETIPFEEERRSYSDRRSSTQGIWKGIERRSGQDRRLVKAAAKAKAKADAEAKAKTTAEAKAAPTSPVLLKNTDGVLQVTSASDSDGQKSSLRMKQWMRAEVRWLVLALTVLNGVTIFAYFKAGWEAGLAAFGFLTAVFFMALFQHLNSKK